MKNRTIAFAVLSVIFSFLLTNAAFAAVFTVTNNSDSGTGSLRQAILDSNSAASDDIIGFDPVVFSSGQVITLTSELAIANNGSLTINGTGSNLLWISGNSTSRVFFIGSGAVVTINNLRVRDGKPSGNGGGVYNDGAVLTINSSELGPNQVNAGFSGGSIYNNSGSLTINQTVIHDSFANGGEGGGIYSTNLGNPNAVLNLNNSTIGGNSASGSGGGIYSRSKLNLTNTQVNSNLALANGLGGGIYTSEETTLNGSSIVQGQARLGGGLYNDNAVVTAINTTFVSNKASDSGGGIYTKGALSISGGNVQTNRAFQGGGGGIHRVSGSLTIANVSFNGNNSDVGNGCGILSDAGNIEISGTTFINNYTPLAGAGIYMSNGTLTMQTSLFTGNLAIIDGGGLYLAGSTANITNSTFGANRAYANGGGIFVDAGSSVNLESSTFSKNISDDDNNGAGKGGGINNTSGGAVNIHNTIISGNIDKTNAAPDFAGAMRSLGYNLIENPTGASGFSNSDVLRQNPQLLPLGAYGGVTQTYKLPHSSPAIDAADPTNYPPTDQRGKARPFDGEPNGSFLPDIGAFEKDTAIFKVTKIADTNDGVCDSDCSLREAIAATAAASTDDIIYFDESVFAAAQTITLNGTQITTSYNGSLTINGTGANRLSISANDLSRAFFINPDAVVIINDLTLRNGQANGDGGAIASLGTLTLNNSTIRNNAASSAGGGVVNYHGTMEINNCLFTELTAAEGGAIFNTENATLNITTTTIRNNQSTRGGGGIANDNSKVTITDSTISGNTSIGSGDGTGGGILNKGRDDNAGVMTIVNSTIANNTTRFGGGGINNFNAILNLTNTTITGNSTISDVIFHYGGGVLTGNNGTLTRVSARNTIIANNTTASGIALDFGGTLTSQGYNLIKNPNGMTVTGITTGNRLGTDPLLGPLADNGGATLTCALLSGSPAIDGADPNNSVVFDQRGVRRLRDGDNNGTILPDMGAFEVGFFVVKPAPFDFDGDGRTDISIFRPVSGEWWINRSSSGATTATRFGNSSDKPVPADFSGDGKTDIAFWRGSTGEWFILRSENGSFLSFTFGANGDLPVAGDFDGDGRADPGVFRPSTGEWFILKSSGGTIITTFGSAGDVPVAADYDGDGKADIAIFRPSDGSWWYLRSSDSQFRVYRFGLGTDKPVQGDYTGDGKADIAVWRPATGEWFVQRSEDTSFYSVPFGANGDLPTPGDYDGDGKFDTAVFRPSGTTWFVNRTTSGLLITNFGASSDRPLPNVFVP